MSEKITAYEDDEKVILHYEDDVEAAIEANKRSRAHYCRSEKKGDFHLAMRVPTIILLKIMNDTGLDFFNKDDAEEIYRILKSGKYHDKYGNWKATEANL